MGRDPDVNLVESLLERFLDRTHGVPVLLGIFKIQANSHKLVLKLLALVLKV
jgi:hypothetical protein